MTIEIPSLDKINTAAAEFLKKTSEITTFAFYGNMGAGKTTFIKAICEQMGITDVINSPTFSIVNEYTLPDGGSVYHFDFYRINKVEEVYDMGYEEYFYSGNKCFMEWPEKIEALLPDDCLKVNIEVLNDGRRMVKADL